MRFVYKKVTEKSFSALIRRLHLPKRSAIIKKAMGRKGDYMLKNRKKMLALILGMSMTITFPVQAAGPEESNGSAVKEETQGTADAAPDASSSDPAADTEDTAGTEAAERTDEQTTESEQTSDKTPTPETDDEPTDPEVIIDKKIESGEIPEIDSETVVENSWTGNASDSETDSSDDNLDERFEKLVIEPEELKPSFRFETVDKEYAVAKKKIRIFTEKDGNAEAAGKLAEGGLCYILKDEGKWCYVESGNVRGFVKSKYIITGDSAKKTVVNKKLVNMETAEALLTASENPAFTYTKTTVQDTVVKGVYGIAQNDELNIREDKSTDARIVGVIPKGGLCRILADKAEEWCYVESGDVRGFVKKELLLVGDEAKKQVKETGRENMALAEEKIAPEDNQALYYTLTSTESAYSRKGKYLGKFKVTAYCACPICCGAYANGITASGTVPVQGQTIAMYGVPFGTKLVVDDVVYTVEDRGTPYGHIDIYMVDHEDAAAFGVQEADVYLAQ